MNIIAIDPGKNCGIATHIAGLVDTHQRNRWSAVDLVDDLIRSGSVNLVVCESFTPRPGVRTWQPDALEIIGALRWICHAHDIRFDTQHPGDAKRFATNDKLAALGWRNPTPGGHADDAARHLLLAAVRYGVIDPAQFT